MRELPTEFNPHSDGEPFETDRKFIWPHDNLDLLKQVRGDIYDVVERGRYVRIALKYAAAKTLGKLGFEGEKTAQEETMAFINGPEASFLADKFKFVELLRQMGYFAPQQTLIYPDQSSASRIDKVNNCFPDPNQYVFCKPLNGSNGRGIKVITSAEVATALANILEAYIVQQAIFVSNEYRYVRYADTDGRFWRMSYEKIKPSVKGDGHSTVWELISEQDLPLRSKIILGIKYAEDLNKVISVNEVAHLTQIGSRFKGSYERLPSEERINALDAFMTKLIQDLEKEIGHHLPLLCFDFGLRQNALTNDVQTMMDNFVPFECQMPFTTPGYYSNIQTPLKTMYYFHQAINGNRCNDPDRQVYESQIPKYSYLTQIVDDIADLAEDLSAERPSYVVGALIQYPEEFDKTKKRIEKNHVKKFTPKLLKEVAPKTSEDIENLFDSYRRSFEVGYDERGLSILASLMYSYYPHLRDVLYRINPNIANF